MFINRVAAYDFIVQEGIDGKTIGHLIVSEQQRGNSIGLADKAKAQYGFELMDNEGRSILSVAPGWYNLANGLISAFLSTYGSQEGFNAQWVEKPHIGLKPAIFELDEE